MKDVVVYSAPWCQGCKVVKKALDSKSVQYEVVDIDTEEGMNKAKELQIRNIPVTLVGGEKFVGSSSGVVDLILKAVGE